jgi:hypothetical protein
MSNVRINTTESQYIAMNAQLCQMSNHQNKKVIDVEASQKHSNILKGPPDTAPTAALDAAPVFVAAVTAPIVGDGTAALTPF